MEVSDQQYAADTLTLKWNVISAVYVTAHCGGKGLVPGHFKWSY
jgi:hypothetical protein